MKKFSLPILLLLCLNILQAQQLEGIDALRMAPRANVITYDREDAIEHLQYDNSSYILPLDDDWHSELNEGHWTLSQSYEFPKDWKGFRIYFRMVVPAGYGLFINDNQIGVSHDCASVTEFDITDQVRLGKFHTLAIRYAGPDDGEQLETFAQIVNEHYFQASILLKPELNIQDYLIETEYDASSQQGSYRLEADLFSQKRKGKCYLELEIWDAKGHQVEKLGKWCFFDKHSEATQVIKSEIPSVQPWNAEIPRLYTAVIRLYDEGMNLVDLIGTKFGFRTIGDRSSLVLNGQTLTLKGVVLNSPIVRNESDMKRLRTELVQMKCHNINAIRVTGINPYCEKLIELCDELGFYVIYDAALAPASNMGSAVAADPDYSELFSNRMRSMYGQLKNHTSIIAWSLGNSQDNGVCMQGAYKTLHQLDTRRPVLYPCAQYADNTDIIALGQANPTTLSQYFSKSQSRSLVMSSYGSAVGNNFGGIEPLWQKVLDHQSIQGGFFDMGDWTHFASKPYVGEIKQLYRPIDVALTSTSADAAEFVITNLCDFRHISDFTLGYVICSNLKSDVVSGDVAMSLKPGESKEFKLKVPKLLLYSGEQLFIKFTLRQRSNTNSVPKNMVLYTAQIPLPSENMPSQAYSCYDGKPLRIVKDSAMAHEVIITNNNVFIIFNDSLGTITDFDYRGNHILTRSPELCFVRNPSENDAADPNGLKQWNRYLMGNMQSEVVSTGPRLLDDGNVGIDVMTRYIGDRGTVLFDVRQSYLILRSGDVLVGNDISVSDQIQSMARMGFVMGVSGKMDSVEWLGRNVESYSDRHASGLIAQQHLPVNELSRRYDLSGQHFGNFAQTAWLSFFNQECGLYADIIDTLCNFSAYPYLDEELAISHGSLDVPKSADWTFHLDYRMAGVGSAVGGLPLNQCDLVKDHKYLFTIHLRPYLRMENDAQDFRRVIYPKVVSNIVDLPVVSKNRERFDGPMQLQMSCPTQGASIHYTLDGTLPTEKSPVYTKPITIQNSVTLMARAFKKGVAPSFVVTEQYSFDYIVSCDFAHKPNTPYNKNASKALFDGERGDVNDLSHGWLGFSGRDVQVDLELGKPITIKGVNLRFAHVPDAWVFAPKRVQVAVSADGKNYSPYAEAEIEYDAASVSMNTVQLQSISVPVKQDQVRFVRIVAQPIDRIPSWHRAKGLKPWVMMDEIEVIDAVATSEPVDEPNKKSSSN